MPTDAAALRALTDRADITDLVLRFAQAFDRQDWAALRACLLPTIEVDYSDLRGDPPATITADEFVAARARALGALRTQHLSTNHLVTVTGDDGECASAFLIHRVDPARGRDNTFDTAGHYTHRVRRTPDGWRIARIEQRVLWNRGNPDVHGALRARKG